MTPERDESTLDQTLPARHAIDWKRVWRPNAIAQLQAIYLPSGSPICRAERSPATQPQWLP
jgi:hypothetical protein